MASRLLKLKYFHFFIIIFVVAVSLFAIRSGINQLKLYQYTQQSINEVALLASREIYKVNAEHLKCLATNIYWEAGSEPFMGQVAVARVVMNRIKHGFATNPCRVIYQTTVIPDLESPTGIKKLCQFSWVCEGKTTPQKNDRYHQAEEIAKKVLTENKWQDILPSNTLFFHNKEIDPNWPYSKVTTIGNHIFYAKKEKNN